MYRTDVYFICKSLADLPLFIILPFIFISIPYYAIGLNPPAEKFFIASGIIILVANVASAFGKKINRSLRFLNTQFLSFLFFRFYDIVHCWHD